MAHDSDDEDGERPLHVTLVDSAHSPCDLTVAARAAGLRVHEASASQRRVTYLDTFDGRLFRSGSVLSMTHADAGIGLHCHSLRGDLLHQLHLPEAPAFSRDMPESRLRSAVAAATGVRRLLPRIEWHESVRHLRVLDDLDKTVAEVEQVRGQLRQPWEGPGQSAAPDIITVTALRGYDDAAQALVDAVRAAAPGYQERSDAYADLMLAAGLRPLGESNRVRVLLEGDARTDRALAAILEALRCVMVANEPGVREDLDPEFLHDYRVAVRRTRSLLSRLKAAFPREPLGYFRGEFAWLGALTGPTRDLDVYITKMPEFRAGLTGADREALDPLETFLLEEQRSEHAALVAGLALPRHAELMQRWAAFLADLPDADGAALATLPIGEVARDVIWRQYRRVRRSGRAIDADTPAEALHRLRIECKKLRYLLEAFFGLFDADGMERLIGSLKRLQDNLGDFNDHDVQGRNLRRFAARMSARGDVPVATLLAIGRLVERVGQRQAAERDLFARRWRRFDSAEYHDFARHNFRSTGATGEGDSGEGDD